jgi:nucleotide-binding universal stress UspA family protein
MLPAYKEFFMKYVWAFNPFDKNKKLDKNAVALIDLLPEGKKSLEAVFVASPNYLDLTSAFNVPAKDRFSQYPKQLVETAIKKLQVEADKCTVLFEKTISLTKSVKMFATYLARNKIDIAIVASRAQTGLSRAFLGSFAETLVHLSPVDLLIFNEDSLIGKRPPQNLLYAHDYSIAADKGLDRVIDYAKTWDCTLHVLHVPDPAFGFKFKGQEAAVEGYRNRVRQKLHRIEKKLEKAGVVGTAELDSKWSPVAERISDRASKVKADFVIVVAKSGKLASLFGGSVTRQVLRTSKVPVLVVKRL